MRRDHFPRGWLLLFAVTAILLVLPAGAQSTAAEPTREEAMVAKAREMWETYYRLEQAFDPAIGDLYSDTALIRNTRRYPDGNVRVMEIDVQKYRALIVVGMPLAKRLDDTNVYTDFRYTIEGDNVRIDSQRFSERKRYTSPMSVLVGPTESGEWKILEEISESQP